MFEIYNFLESILPLSPQVIYLLEILSILLERFARVLRVFDYVMNYK